MSGGDSRKVSCEDIKMVQNRIEQCLRRYMSREEVVNALFINDNIEPRFTQIIWQKLLEENQEFFKQYFLNLMLKEQILKFNELLSKQVTLMHQSAIASLPVSNGSNISPCKLSKVYQNSRCHIADNVGASINSKDMQNTAPINLPNTYNGCSSTLHPCIQPMGNMLGQNGKVDVNPNMLLAQPSNVGMTSTMNGNLIKLEPGYDNRSPFNFGTHGNLFESCSVAVGNTPISSFSSVESNTQHPNDALLDADTSWLRQAFSFADLTADFSNNSDLLENLNSYRPHFLADDTGNLLDSNDNIEQINNNSSGLRYEGFSGD